MYSAGDQLPDSIGDKLPESIGDKLPESTGEMVQLSWGNFALHWGMAPLDVRIPLGNNLILRLPGMLVEECPYSAGDVEIFWGHLTSLRLTVD